MPSDEDEGDVSDDSAEAERLLVSELGAPNGTAIEPGHTQEGVS